MDFFPRDLSMISGGNGRFFLLFSLTVLLCCFIYSKVKVIFKFAKSGPNTSEDKEK